MVSYDICLTLLNVIISRSIHTAANEIIMKHVCIYIYIYIYIYVYIYTQTHPMLSSSTPLSVDTQLLPFLAVVNSADVNILISQPGTNQPLLNNKKGKSNLGVPR